MCTTKVTDKVVDVKREPYGGVLLPVGMEHA
jgi:hypothetical protein